MAQKILSSAEEMIGGTPLLRLGRVTEKYAPSVEILAKCEFFNPAGSVKDRVAKSILDEAERQGKISPATLLIEPTSGNTGIGIAALAALRGYRALIVMPENMSQGVRASPVSIFRHAFAKASPSVSSSG